MNKTNFDPKLVFGSAHVFVPGCSQDKIDRLVGLDEIKADLAQNLDILFNPHKPKDWSSKHYGVEIEALKLLEDIVPLIIFEGDVGTGKSALAESIGALIANEHGYEVQLLKMSTQVRGKGFVGEMGTLLSESFQYVDKQTAKAGCPTLLIIDEADSLLTSRTETGQHHEDKAGVNTIIQNLDDLNQKSISVAVIAITNRYDVLDAAVKRRSTAHYTFVRPSLEQRMSLFRVLLTGTDLTEKDINSLAKATCLKKADTETAEVEFSYSDLTLKIIIPALRDAVEADEKISVERLMERATSANPSPRL